ncbi:hypothetical protein V8B55DRAFT_1499434 [Mucor lusitanicus]|uniref:Uncharacterized protein n=1 Tax=Mucor circinelloides f. lusitanicus TaxID=29924 RepID=A0A8H4BNF4_MUCCL|nr:hypothetical protein FB192DRAFT_1358227 [Mucor lusitanicus]
MIGAWPQGDPASPYRGILQSMDLAALLNLWRLWWLSLAATQPSSMFLSRVYCFCCCMVPGSRQIDIVIFFKVFFMKMY